MMKPQNVCKPLGASPGQCPGRAGDEHAARRSHIRLSRHFHTLLPQALDNALAALETGMSDVPDAVEVALEEVEAGLLYLSDVLAIGVDLKHAVPTAKCLHVHLRSGRAPGTL